MDKIILMYLIENKSIINISKEIGWSYKKVRNYLLKNNIKLRKRNTKGLRFHSRSTRNKMRNSALGEKNHNYKKCSEKTRKIFKDFRNKVINDPKLKEEIYKKVSKTRIERKLSVGKNNPMSNPDTIKKWIKSNNLKPNKSELKLFEILQKFNIEFLLNTRAEYLIIEGKIPDFINLKKKRIIELYGDYWHRNDTKEKIEKRVNLFKKSGYNTLIVWENELKNINELKIKLNNYVKNS
ncbi:MAG: NUMOD3 domain-containing DNA-binding protein [Candidatus Nanoarchaeia archaeon]|nr:NUMOD3 domain-containing DNA-binding protein [Candidatus Nanoarchaeia archaeon]